MSVYRRMGERESNLVFYAQSAVTVISGRERERERERESNLVFLRPVNYYGYISQREREREREREACRRRAVV